MKNFKKSFFIISLIFLSLIITPTVSAVVNNQNNQSISGSRIQTATQNTGASTTLRNTIRTVANGAIDKCSTIESRIQLKVGNFDNKKISHLEAYNNMKERLAKIDVRLTEKGLNTSKLKSYLVVLDEKIKKFTIDYANYINKLKESQISVCGKSKGEFLAKIKEAKAALKIVHQDILDIKSYYVNTIKPELQNLKKQLNDLIATSSKSTNLNLENQANLTE